MRTTLLVIMLVALVLLALGYVRLTRRLRQDETETARLKDELAARDILDHVPEPEPQTPLRHQRSHLRVIKGGVIAAPAAWLINKIRDHPTLPVAVYGAVVITLITTLIVIIQEDTREPKIRVDEPTLVAPAPVDVEDQADTIIEVDLIEPSPEPEAEVTSQAESGDGTSDPPITTVPPGSTGATGSGLSKPTTQAPVAPPSPSPPGGAEDTSPDTSQDTPDPEPTEDPSPTPTKTPPPDDGEEDEDKTRCLEDLTEEPVESLEGCVRKLLELIE